VIDKSSRIAAHGGIYYEVIINLEHITADAATVIVTLPFVCQCGANQLAGILNNHFTWLKKGL